MTTPTAPAPSPGARYLFNGHAIGASAHFHTLDQTTGLNHLVPAQAASVLPQTGGLSQGSAASYTFPVTHPRPRTLFSIVQAESKATGLTVDGAHRTEVSVDLENVRFVEKLRIGLVRLHMLSTYRIDGTAPALSTTGNRLEDVWLGNVQAVIELDDEPLAACGTQEQLAAFYRSQDATYRQQYAWRFATPAGEPEIAKHGAHYKCSVVKGIQLVGPQDAKQSMSVDGYTIVWKGFGKIILGEIHVKGTERHLTMARLAMGSDAGGTASAGDGKTNGVVVP